MFPELVLENDALEVALIPSLGCLFTTFRVKEFDRNLLYVDDERLRSEGLGPDAPGDVEAEGLLRDYAFGGLVTMFPNAGAAYEWGSYDYAFHGDLRSVGWACELQRQDDRVEARLRGESRGTPFAIDRTIVLRADSTCIEVRDQIVRTDDSADAAPWAYGIHPYLGAPLIGGQSRILIDGRDVMSLSSGDSRDESFDCLHTGAATSVAIENADLGCRLRIGFNGYRLPHLWRWTAPRWSSLENVAAVIPCTAHGLYGAESSALLGTAPQLGNGATTSITWSLGVEFLVDSRTPAGVQGGAHQSGDPIRGDASRRGVSDASYAPV